MTETHKYVKGDDVFWLFWPVVVLTCMRVITRRNLSSREKLQVGDEGRRQRGWEGGGVEGGFEGGGGKGGERGLTSGVSAK